MCYKCRYVVNKQLTREPCKNEAQASNSTLCLPNIARAGNSKAFCVICRAPYKSGLTVTIPENAELDLLFMFKIYASE